MQFDQVLHVRALGTDLDKGYMPHVRSSTGEDMGALGQVTYTFKINDTPFTQSFIVCRNMNRHMILGIDFTATNFVGVIWTCEGTRKLMHSNGKTIMELPDTTAGIPLAMAYSVKIEPGGTEQFHWTVAANWKTRWTSGLMQGFTTETQMYIYSPQLYK